MRCVVPPTIHRISVLQTELRPFTECSLFTSCRGAVCPNSSYEFAPSAVSSPNSISCTPPSQGPHPSVSTELCKVHHLIYLTGAVRHIANRLRSGDRLGILRRAMSCVSRSVDRQHRRPVTPVSVSVFGGRNAPPLQSPFPGPNVIETPLPRACRCHSPRLAMSLRSGTRPFENRSLFTSCRGAIYPCFSYELTPLATLLPNSKSCTPPALHGRGRKKESL